MTVGTSTGTAGYGIVLGLSPDSAGIKTPDGEQALALRLEQFAKTHYVGQTRLRSSTVQFVSRDNSGFVPKITINEFSWAVGAFRDSAEVPHPSARPGDTSSARCTAAGHVPFRQGCQHRLKLHSCTD